MNLTPPLSIRDLDISGRRVFVRCDFNVPLDDGAIADDTRVRGAVPTLRHVLDGGGSLVLASHLGRPKGPDPSLSLAPVAKRLEELLEAPVRLTPDASGDEAASLCAGLEPGGVVLLENLRFHPEEKAGDADFARRLASFADLYCNDAFGTCHRADASVATVPKHFDRPAAGLLVRRELEALGRLLASPEKPFVALLGGAKVSDKLPIIESLLPLVDELLIGGAMAYTFLSAREQGVGASLVEPALASACRDLLRAAEERETTVVLPVDHVVVAALDAPETARVVRGGDIGPTEIGVDVGPETRALHAASLARARTILWNGPLGIFETPEYAQGTHAAARAVAASAGFSVVGGGDSVAAVTEAGLAGEIDHVSTGGGAMLELLAGRPMPGLDVLAPAEPGS